MTKAFGYAGKILRADLSSGTISTLSTGDYADRFLGGRGIAAKIYWDEVLPSVKAFDPDNRLIFVTGPLAGVPGVAGSRTVICGKSPTTIPELFSYSNLGGSWGTQLKFAGYDGLIIQGKSAKPIYLYIDNQKAEFRDATHLWGKGAIEVRQILKNENGSSTRVVSIGPGGENGVTFASLLADEDASASSGFGAVMGSKGLKAIAVRGKGNVLIAYPERLQELRRYIRVLVGKPPGLMVNNPSVKRSACYGCVNGCMRCVYETKDGQKGKVLCQSGLFYQSRPQQDFSLPRGKVLMVEEWDEVAFLANRLCDDYGLDTNVIEVMINWLSICSQSGILTDSTTGIPLSKVGSLEFMESLMKMIVCKEGFGEILAQGNVKAAELLGTEAGEVILEQISRAGQDLVYEPRSYITTGIFYAMEPRQPIQHLHEISFLMSSWLMWAYKVEGSYASSDVVRAIARKFWGSEEAADFSTYEGKALAAKKIQERQYAKECLILCDFLWPIMLVESSTDHIGDSSIESQVLSAVTGNDVDEQELYYIAEKVFNLQRAILIRDGHRGKEDDVLPEACFSKPLDRSTFNPQSLLPGKYGEFMSREGSILDRDKFERMKEEYYSLRGWDINSGLQKDSVLQDLGLGDVAEDLIKRKLVASS